MGDSRGRADRAVNRVREAWAFRGRLRRLATLTFDQPSDTTSRADVIVSLTSYRPRLPFIGLAVRSLLDQSVSPACVQLWVPAADTDSVPSEVRALERAGLEVRATDRDLGPAGKLLPALREQPGAVVVTADDDVVYPRHWLRDLLRGHERWPEAIVCVRAHELRFADDGSLLPYADWAWDSRRTGTDLRLFFTGHGGVLYPPGALPRRAHDDDLRSALCPRADDVWFNWMARLAGTPIARLAVSVPRHNDVPGSQGTTLMSDNVAGGDNDAQIRNLVEHIGPLDPVTGALRALGGR